MAYRIEEIEKVLSSVTEWWERYFPGKSNVSNIPNYEIITDYLTGKSNVLHGLQHDQHGYSWIPLASLLTDIENISLNQQLVLDVIQDPAILPFLRMSLHHWVIGCMLKSTTDTTFQAAISQFKKQGMKDDDIFNLLISTLAFKADFETGTFETPLSQFMLSHIRKSKMLALPTQSFIAWNKGWSWFYFKHLEEANIEFALQYVQYGIHSHHGNPITEFIDYKEGKYLPALISYISKMGNSNQEIITSKLNPVIRLYEASPERFKDLLLQISQQYLEFYLANYAKYQWESSYSLKEFEGTENSYLHYSACCMHFLLKFEKAKALTLLDSLQQKKNLIPFEALSIIYYHLGNDSFPYFEAAIKNDSGGIDYNRKVVQFMQKQLDPVKYLSLLWSMVNSKSKPLRELIAGIIVDKDPAGENKAIALLENKNAETRQTAAHILSNYSTVAAKDAILKVVNTEGNDNARDILLSTIAESLPAKPDIKFVQDTIEAAQKRGKLNKPIEAWIDEDQLPSLYYISGSELDTTEKRFLLYRMSRIKTMRSDIEAKYLLNYIDKDKAAAFALALINIFREKGGKPEHKYLMALAALLGNDQVVDKIRIVIDHWMEEQRHKMAEHGVGALAIQGSDKALRWVEWYSRKYRSRYANVGAAALIALETAAEELGITTHELGDRIVPDFGFDGLFKHFTIGSDAYRAFIDSHFKMAFFDEDNKKLKSIPVTADAALKDEFKSITKEVREIVKSQTPRLEYYLIIQRKWNWPQWQQFFLNNPVMFIYATKLVWGTYSSNGELLQTFICNDDASLINEEQEEITIDENAIICIVHPTQLSPEKTTQWKQLLFDLSIEQMFLQLDRKMPSLDQLDLSKTIIYQYERKHMVTGSIKTTLEKYGWHKGPTGDGGMIDYFQLLYHEKKLEAILEVEGVGAGYGWGLDEKLGRLYIIDKTKTSGRRVNYVKSEEDEKLVRLGDVPKIFLSEMLAAVEGVREVAKG